ncbi:hypothetical protein ACFYYR_12820 [Streptomyces sp. NPDC001922]|uniref:hypothetical protein n=1 Tax=Streptomyces sp. NPDC001922 TaxID=3364624 RepID=UPI00368DB948
MEAERKPRHREITMFAYELQRDRQEELMRVAARHRLAREAVRARRDAARGSAGPEAEGRVSRSASRDGGGTVRAARV